MFTVAHSHYNAVQRLRDYDSTLKDIRLNNKLYTDEDLKELVECLLSHPDVITDMFLHGNQITDETGIKLARYVAISSTIKVLDLSNNQLGDATYLAMAAALRVNSSLRRLYLYRNQVTESDRIDAVFIDALILNPNRPARSEWRLYSYASFDTDFYFLKGAAEQLGHPSMQAMLATQVFGVVI